MGIETWGIRTRPMGVAEYIEGQYALARRLPFDVGVLVVLGALASLVFLGGLTSRRALGTWAWVAVMAVTTLIAGAFAVVGLYFVLIGGLSDFLWISSLCIGAGMVLLLRLAGRLRRA